MRTFKLTFEEKDEFIVVRGETNPVQEGTDTENIAVQMTKMLITMLTGAEAIGFGNTREQADLGVKVQMDIAKAGEKTDG